MGANEDKPLARALTRFLEQQCVRGEHYTIPDDLLFSRFHTFWIQAPEYFDHPALLGQFRIELIQQGFHTNPTGKWPHWSGLTLREAVDEG